MGDAALLHFVEKAWPVVLAGAPGVWALWKASRAARKEGQKERTDLIAIAQEAAGAVIQDLRDEGTRLQKRLDTVEAELSKLRKEHAEMMANKDAKITMLEGEKRQLEAEIASLQRILARHGIPAPKRGELYWDVGQDGGLTPRGSGEGAAA